MNKNFLMTAILGLSLVLVACQKDENKSNQAPANPAVNGGGDAGGAGGGVVQRPTPGISADGSISLEGVWISQCRPARYLWNVPGVGAQPTQFTREIVVFDVDQSGNRRIQYIIEDSSEYDYDCKEEPNFQRIRLALKGVYTVRPVSALGVIQLNITHTSCTGGPICPAGSNLSSIGVYPNEVRYVRVITRPGNNADMLFGVQGGPMQVNQDMSQVFRLQSF